MKISFSLRAFVFYFIILALLSWFIIDKAVERMNIALRQSAESVLVDTANLLATSLEQSLDEDGLDTANLQRMFAGARERELGARIYHLLQDRVDTGVYVTDSAGMVVFDSDREHTGEDFSGWRDVSLTLSGRYGARTSYRYADRTGEDDPKIMVIAAPVRQGDVIVGVVSVVKPIDTLEAFLLDESGQLKRYAIGLLALAMVFGYLVSHGFTRAINRLADYTDAMAAGRKVPPPGFMDKRLDRLSGAITGMREQIDGKAYVEDYIHSLTHELKTPLTAISASAELLEGDPQEDDRRRFSANIRASAGRMARLVDRLLSLARLEGRTGPGKVSEFDLVAALNRLLDERGAIIAERRVGIDRPDRSSFPVRGDPLLIQQAVANLLDNALDFCKPGGGIRIDYRFHDGQYEVAVTNQGPSLDGFVLERAFERFFSVPPAAHAAKRNGLGLSFVREIMAVHQGIATLENVPGGVRASLRWPAPDQPRNR
jgi:two-component system sensor histidine kinase CreC